MSWPRRLFLALALLLAAGLTWMVGQERRRTPAEQLAELEARIARREHHSELVLLEGLEATADLAEGLGETDVAARARLVRGELLLALGAAGRAREDFQLVLERYLPGDLEVRRRVVEARVAEEDHAGALADLETLLADEPGYGPAWTQAGALHRRIAGERLERCGELLARVFSRAALERSRPLLVRLAAQDLGDPRRATTLAELRALGPRWEDEHLSQALLWTEEASRESALAREAFARSLELYPDPEAVAGLASILVDADRWELASDLGRVVMRHPELAGHLATNGLLLRAAVARDDLRLAGLVARNLMRAPAIEPELLVLAGHALYEANDFQRLMAPNGPLQRLRQTSRPHGPVADLYSGLVIARRGDPGRALQNLRSFAVSGAEEPFEGARLLAWREVARLARATGNTFLEREALHAAVQLAPDADASLWYRLHELQSGGGAGSSTLPLASLTQALRLAPRQTEQILPLWRELGERALQEEGLDLDSLFQSLRAEGRTLPQRPPRPHTMFRLAELWRETREPARVRFLTRRLLDDLPGFLPALDLALDAAIDLRRWPDVAELVVQRVEAVGADARSEAILAELSAERLQPEQLLRLMEAAPAEHGRRLVAERQRADGWPDRALATLAGGTGSPDFRTRALAAELLVEAGEYRRALELAQELPGGGAAAARARRTALLAALRTQALERVRGLLGAALADPQGSPEDLLGLSHLLASFGEVDLARGLLRSLDQAGGARGEGLFLGLAVADLLDDRPEAARVALTRAEFFGASNRATLGLLLACVQGGDWDRAAPLARELRSDERVAGARDALLALLEGLPEEAVELAEGTVARSAGDSFAELVRGLARAAAGLAPDVPRGLDPGGKAVLELALGSRERPRDARQGAALLLALESPAFAPLARRELRLLLRQNLAPTWSAFLLARTDLALGDPAAARFTLEALTTGHPGFRPAWDELEALEGRRLAPEHPERVALRARRLPLDARGPEELATYLARSELFLSRDQLAEAYASAARALELAPQSGAARAALAAVLTAQGEVSAALVAWQLACLGGTAAEARDHAPAYLAALQRALEKRPPALLPAQVEPALERLRERLPEDPWVVLALAELDLSAHTQGAQSGAARARSRLGAFRALHAGRPLDSLRPGSAERWGELLLGLDPRAAREFARAELRLDPAHVGVRLLEARALREEGRAHEALASLAILARMAADPRIDLERAACLIATGSPWGDVDAQLRSAQAFGPDAARADRVAYLRARSRLDAGAEPRAQVLEDLERYWRAGAALLADPAGPAGALGFELGYLLALHLCLGDTRAEATRLVDGALVRGIVARLLPGTRDPYRRACLTALGGLATHYEALDRGREE